MSWSAADSITVNTSNQNIALTPYLLSDLHINTQWQNHNPQSPDYQYYDGFVHCGYYLKGNIPYFMLVNRRTEYFDNRFIANPHPSPAYVPEDDYSSYFRAASPQLVEFTPNNAAYTNIGSYLALYDPYDSTMYNVAGTHINVSILPGDGKLLQMVGTLPTTVTSNADIRGVGRIQGAIHITNGSTVTLSANSEVRLVANSTITVDSGCTLNIEGKLFGNANTKIIGNGGLLKIRDTAQLLHVNLEGTFYVRDGNTITIRNNSHVTLLPDCQINILYGSSISLYNPVSFKSGSSIHSYGGDVYITGSHSFEENSGIKIESTGLEGTNGTLTIINSGLSNVGGSEWWTGIDANYAKDIRLENCVFYGALYSVQSHNSNLHLKNNIFYIPHLQQDTLAYSSCGVLINNDAPGKVIRIISDEPGKGFFGNEAIPVPSLVSNGISMCGRCDSLLIKGNTFRNLYQGIYSINAFVARDTISTCSFYDCAKGINIISIAKSGVIDSCNFSQTPMSGNTDHQNHMIGIEITSTTAKIRNCTFTNCLGSGILAESTVRTRYDMIIGCSFTNCSSGIESMNSNAQITGSHFDYNNYGLLCHENSNLNLTHTAHNRFTNLLANIKFENSRSYQSYIQLTYGHNDFYHFRDPLTEITACDFEFDKHYFDGEQVPIIKAYGNWFQNNNVEIKPTECSGYVDVGIFDEAPNTIDPPNYNGRYMTALRYEADEQYGEAYALYKDILGDPLPGEMDYLGCCVDGMYRIAMNKEYPVTENINYFNEKVLQYATSDPYLVKLLESYLIKEFVLDEDFQSAINLIQPRIDNPISELDSLRAVLDIEIILQLAAMSPEKRPISTTCLRYKYPDAITFSIKTMSIGNNTKCF